MSLTQSCLQNSRLPALLLYPSMFDLSVIYRPTRSAVHLQSDSSPAVVHLQFTCSCASVPCSPSAALLAVHLPVLLAVHLPVHFSSPAAVLCSTSALGAKLESLSPTPRSLGGPLLLTVKLELPSPSTRVLHQSSILGCCLSHSSTLHRQLTPSCSDDHLHTPTSYSRG